jgi:RimJ/RimL family protein N-acetyltransferase
MEVRKIINVNNNDLNIIVNWMYNWWGKEDNYTEEEVKEYIEHSFQKDTLPQTYGLYLDNKLIGMYQFTYRDLNTRPDIYPWLANVYIDEDYRGKGYSKIMLNTIGNNLKNNTSFKEIYLYTKYDHLYENFGWKYIADVNNYHDNPKKQRLYILKI